MERVPTYICLDKQEKHQVAMSQRFRPDAETCKMERVPTYICLDKQEKHPGAMSRRFRPDALPQGLFGRQISRVADSRGKRGRRQPKGEKEKSGPTQEEQERDRKEKGRARRRGGPAKPGAQKKKNTKLRTLPTPRPPPDENSSPCNSLTHPEFRGHLVGHSPQYFGPGGPKDYGGRGSASPWCTKVSKGDVMPNAIRTCALARQGLSN